ncbi:hypothetical protein M1N16_01160 [Nitrospinaceae bacterium]|nr:hypothetical protein [Nitrospinaceae bacterium]
MKTIRRNSTSTVVWLVVLFLFISSSGCALLKQSENKIAQSNFVPLSNFDREWYFGQLPESKKPQSTDSKPPKSLQTKLLEKKWLANDFCLTTQYIVYILMPDTRYTYVCGVGAIHEGPFKVVF